MISFFWNIVASLRSTFRNQGTKYGMTLFKFSKSQRTRNDQIKNQIHADFTEKFLKTAYKNFEKHQEQLLWLSISWLDLTVIDILKTFGDDERED